MAINCASGCVFVRKAKSVFLAKLSQTRLFLWPNTAQEEQKYRAVTKLWP